MALEGPTLFVGEAANAGGAEHAAARAGGWIPMDSTSGAAPSPVLTLQWIKEKVEF